MSEDSLGRTLGRALVLIEQEDETGLRALIQDAGIEPGVHVGEPPGSFDGDPIKTTEYVLGQWADSLDNGSSFLNTIRNVTLTWFEQGKLVEVPG